MHTLEQIKASIATAVPGALLEIIPNASPANQPSLLVGRHLVLRVATFLRDDPACRFDYASNVTGVDWPEKTVKEKVKTAKLVDGAEKVVEELVERKTPGCLEAVYHLFSMELGHGPLILRLRTENRTDKITLPSLTPVWRSCEFQEREIFDLFGVIFEGHPDLRRILMWDDFAAHPMRKDYVPANRQEAKS